MDTCQPSFSDLSLPCFVQRMKGEPDLTMRGRDFSIIEFARFKGRLEANYDVFQQMGPIVDPFILPGYLFVFKKMSKGDVLAGVVALKDVPVEESIVMSFTVVLKDNDEHGELMGLAGEHPEYGYKMPPEPPYCAIMPLDLFTSQWDNMDQILRALRGYALAWMVI